MALVRTPGRLPTGPKKASACRHNLERLERDGDGWRPRRGRVPDGYFDEKRATVTMAALIAEHDAREAAIECGERRRRERGVTVRELAAEWLEYLEREKGARPSTLSDYRYMLAEPGTPHLRGAGENAGRIMRALGDANIRDVTSARTHGEALRSTRSSPPTGGGLPRTAGASRFGMFAGLRARSRSASSDAHSTFATTV